MTLFISLEYCAANMSLSGCLILTSFLELPKWNILDVSNNLVWFIPFLSLCINLRVIDLKLILFELVISYLFVSPLAIALMVAGG